MPPTAAPNPLSVRTILLASVLKPLDDTRMYEKFGRTLAERPAVQVHVAGRQAPFPAAGPPNLQTHALLAGTRLSWARLAAQGRYWRLLRRLRPELVIVHAPELLPLTLLWQVLGPQRRFVYDVRENYALNIRSQAVYPAWLRGLLAAAVRGLETLATRRAARIVLAERSYADELPFATPSRTVTLENKYQPLPGSVSLGQARPMPAPGEPLRLLYSGTISRLNGVFEAVGFVQKLREQWPSVHLTIIGVCQQPDVLAELQAVVALDASLTLVGGANLVPHARIVAEIQRSHLGLLAYQPHPSTARCVPTKLFEYLANSLPVLTSTAALWTPMVLDLQAGLAVSFKPPFDNPDIIKRLVARPFYPQGPPSEAFWAGEATKLWAVVDSMQ